MSRALPEVLEFEPGDVEAVAGSLATLAADGSWANLLPGLRPDLLDLAERPGSFAFLLGARPQPWAMGTVVRGATVEVGVAHPRGRLGSAHLTELGLTPPAGWRLTQDHGRRGLVLVAPGSTGMDAVARYLVTAVAVLSTVPAQPRWSLEVTRRQR